VISIHGIVTSFESAIRRESRTSEITQPFQQHIFSQALKRGKSNETCVVLCVLSTGNYQYCTMSIDEFRDFVRSADMIEKELRSTG
jgi:hypothetical protein